jgi:CheY-like chemotaxis protein
MLSPDGDPPKQNGRRNGFPTILVAEREGDVRKALVLMLQNDGYLVLEADDEIEAIEIARVHSRPIHLLLTGEDLDSRTLAATLKHFRPQMEVLFVPERPEPGAPPIANHVLVRISEFLQPRSTGHLDPMAEKMNPRRGAAKSIA